MTYILTGGNGSVSNADGTDTADRNERAGACMALVATVSPLRAVAGYYDPKGNVAIATMNISTARPERIMLMMTITRGVPLSSKEKGSA